VVIIAREPAIVTLSSEYDLARSIGASQPSIGDSNTAIAVQNVEIGINMLCCPLVENGGMRAVLERNGCVVIDFRPRGFVFNPNPETYNFNAFVAMYPAQKK
jgi:hypothetical protein